MTLQGFDLGPSEPKKLSNGEPNKIQSFINRVSIEWLFDLVFMV
jgi:hypothetical protein